MSRKNIEQDFLTRILLDNRRRERGLSPHACLSRTGKRLFPEEIPDSRNIRAVFSHDADRIMHSKAYARYIDKTQVFYLFENDHITHRVLHVQFVSKIGRTIGRALKLNEDLIDAIALGHDLGHVPYGHDGEKVLDRLCHENNIGGFGHNVQSVRWLMNLEKKGRGLNLSVQVLDGILSHNGELLNREYVPHYKKTLDQIQDEYEKCMANAEYGKKVFPMTLEGCVARIADVIAYVGRDIEDAIIIGLIKRSDIPEDSAKVLGSTNREIIDRLAIDLIENSYGKDHLEFSADVFNALHGLLDFNYKSIYQNAAIKTESYKIEHLFKHLFESYLKDLENKNRESVVFTEFLDGMDESYTRKTENARIVADFISGMTDNFFNHQYEDLFVPKSLGHDLKDRVRQNFHEEA